MIFDVSCLQHHTLYIITLNNKFIFNLCIFIDYYCIFIIFAKERNEVRKTVDRFGSRKVFLYYVMLCIT